MKILQFAILFFVTSNMNSQTLHDELEKIFNQNKLMGLTVHTFSGNKTETYNFGLQNEKTKHPITNKTIFRIASISKTFTALGLMKLYDQKKFKLNDDISDYLGFKVRNPKFPNTKITFKMLLSHTSSLMDGTGYDNFLGATFSEKPSPNIDAILKTDGNYFTNDIWMSNKPGTFFTYCNLNYGLIGTLIEKISQQRFDLFINKEILEPLGISASFNLDHIELEDLATLYRSENNTWKPEKDDYSITKPKLTDVSTYEIGNNAVLFGPQGGLRASATDLICLLRFLKSDGKTVPNLISKRTLKKMKNAQWRFDKENGDNYNGFFKQYSLGLHLTNKNNSDLICSQEIFGNFIGHAGDAYGLISDAYFSEKENFGFVIITNGSFEPFVKGKNSSFYNFEEAIFKILCSEHIKNKI